MLSACYGRHSATSNTTFSETETSTLTKSVFLRTPSPSPPLSFENVLQGSSIRCRTVGCDSIAPHNEEAPLLVTQVIIAERDGADTVRPGDRPPLTEK